jgi:hypothetical protein
MALERRRGLYCLMGESSTWMMSEKQESLFVLPLLTFKYSKTDAFFLIV